MRIEAKKISLGLKEIILQEKKIIFLRQFFFRLILIS